MGKLLSVSSQGAAYCRGGEGGSSTIGEASANDLIWKEEDLLGVSESRGGGVHSSKKGISTYCREEILQEGGLYRSSSNGRGYTPLLLSRVGGGEQFLSNWIEIHPASSRSGGERGKKVEHPLHVCGGGERPTSFKGEGGEDPSLPRREFLS